MEFTKKIIEQKRLETKSCAELGEAEVEQIEQAYGLAYEVLKEYGKRMETLLDENGKKAVLRVPVSVREGEKRVERFFTITGAEIDGIVFLRTTNKNNPYVYMQMVNALYLHEVATTILTTYAYAVGEK